MSLSSSPTKGTRAPISHPYPPTYRPRTSDPPPPSQSYTYDQHRRPQAQAQHQSYSGSSFSDSMNPYDPPLRPYQAGSGPGIPGKEVIGLDSPPEMGGAKTVQRGPKIGKGQYAENWTKEDEEAERAFVKQGMFNWKELIHWRFWLRTKWWYWYLIIIILCVLVALMTLYHDQIVNWLTPVANWMKALPAGWTIPIAVLFVLSFPPLFGQEIVCVLVGAVWGLWVGFAIVSAGTFIGEIGNFYAFKYCLRSHALRLEEKNPNYACLAHIVREGGFFLIFVIRLSAIPGHFSTAVFATCGMNVLIFSAATILTLPKQLIIVYLGVIFADQSEKDNKERIITWTTLIIGLVLTAWSGWYIYRKMSRARVVLWRRERIAQKATAAEGLAAGGPGSAQVNRRISYRAMLEQPNDDIEALSPMLPKNNNGSNGVGMRQAYGTPYELQQVQPPPLHTIQDRNRTIPPSHSTSGDFSLPPPSYRSPDSATSVPALLGPIGPSRKDSGTLPPDPIIPADPEHQALNQANLISDNPSSYDVDRHGPIVREREHIDFGYNPNSSTEAFPIPQPHPDTMPGGRRPVSDYDPPGDGWDHRREIQGEAVFPVARPVDGGGGMDMGGYGKSNENGHGNGRFAEPGRGYQNEHVYK